MKTILLLFLVIICGNVAMAQENLMPLMPEEKDSSQIKREQQVLYHKFLTGALQSEGITGDLEIPKFDFNTVIAHQRYNFYIPKISNSFQTEMFLTGIPGFYPSPFFRNGSIFSSATYNLNEKFKLGGYSFGANSVFSAPFPNQNMNNFDTRGATMFLEYKISDKFKIETKVSVSQGNKGPGF